MPLTIAQGSIAATSLRERLPSPAARSSGVRPAASAAPTTAPKEVPTIATTSCPASMIARQAPTQANAFAPPPLNTAATRATLPPNAERGTWNAECQGVVVRHDARREIPHSAFPIPHSVIHRAPDQTADPSLGWPAVA